MARNVTFPLLLLLGLFAILCPLWAMGPQPPAGFTPVSWFQKQHILEKPKSCQAAMNDINQFLNGLCKRSNTFLHVSLQNVKDVCALKAFQCRDKSTTCHRSPAPVQMTVCKIMKDTNSCTYRESHTTEHFTVQCMHRFNDPKMELLPVHLE
uniref:Ribonuclease K6 n=1 Tax=Cavia porcellus TaxID=10141 RepID=H0VVN7_CAVPO